MYFTHRQLVLHTMGVATIMGSIDSVRLLGTNDVYMPITPMFHVHAWGLPYVATMLGLKQVYPGRYDPEFLVQLWRKEKGHLFPLRADHPANGPQCQGGPGHRFRRLEKSSSVAAP
nr:hypothetical protein GCM10020185_19230 [Pseudomonas brassicacearum subsp. brassicacearum]